MNTKMSDYEYEQASQFINDVCLTWQPRLNGEDAMEECWIAYLEGKRKYRCFRGTTIYWDAILELMTERLNRIRHIKNERIGIESRLSLNSKAKDCKEEIGSIIRGKTGDFVNGIALRDFSKQLGGQKYKIIRLLSAGEEKADIMKILGLSEYEYCRYILELQKDFLICSRILEIAI